MTFICTLPKFFIGLTLHLIPIADTLTAFGVSRVAWSEVPVAAAFINREKPLARVFCLLLRKVRILPGDTTARDRLGLLALNAHIIERSTQTCCVPLSAGAAAHIIEIPTCLCSFTGWVGVLA